MIIERLPLENLENKTTKPPKWAASKTGYGRKIPTRFMVRLPGGKRWRRVYCCQYSNSGTCYVETRSGNWIVIY